MDPTASNGVGDIVFMLGGATIVLILSFLFKAKVLNEKNKLGFVKFVAGLLAVIAAIFADTPSTNGFFVDILGRAAIAFFVYYFVTIVFGFLVIGSGESANKKK